MFGKHFIVICSLLMAGIGYVSYVSFPEECDYPYTIKFLHSFVQLTTYTCSFVEKLGFQYYDCTRLREFGFRDMPDGIVVEKEIFGGVSSTIIKPKDFSTTTSNPAILYYHGGGWSTGTFGVFARSLKKLVEESRMMVIYFEYRLSPEHVYPIPFDDCFRATIDFMKRAKDFNVNLNKIVLAGDSAGGNLATAVALNLYKKMKNFRPCMMNLIYPVLQMSNFMLPSYQQNLNAPLLPYDEMLKFYLSYMGILNETDLIEPMKNNLHVQGSKNIDALQRTSSNWVPKRFKKKETKATIYKPTEHQIKLISKYRTLLQTLAFDSTFAPLTASDEEIKSLPPTHILTSEYDVLRDDGIILHERMKSLGLKVSHQNLQFGTHALLIFYGIPYKKLDDAVASMIEVMKKEVESC